MLWHPCDGVSRCTGAHDSRHKNLSISDKTGSDGMMDVRLLPQIKDLAISADNSRFVSVGADKQFYLWDVSAKRVVRKFVGHSSAVNTVAMNAVRQSHIY